MSLVSYRKVQAAACTPRSHERRLVAEITGEMIACWAAGQRGAQLMPVLHRNREMWTVFSSACGAQGNELPAEVRASIISLALWVDRFTSAVIARQKEITALVEVNQDMLEGLMN